MRKWRIIRFQIKYVAWPTEAKMQQDRVILEPLGVVLLSFRIVMSKWKWPSGSLHSSLPCLPGLWSFVFREAAGSWISGAAGMLRRDSTCNPSGPLWKKYFFLNLCSLKWVVFYFILSSKLRFEKLWAGLLRKQERVRAVPPTQGPWSGGVSQGSALALCRFLVEFGGFPKKKQTTRGPLPLPPT